MVHVSGVGLTCTPAALSTSGSGPSLSAQGAAAVTCDAKWRGSVKRSSDFPGGSRSSKARDEPVATCEMRRYFRRRLRSSGGEGGGVGVGCLV